MALAVRAGELTIRPPAVVDQGPGKCDQRAKGVECLLAAVGIGIEPRATEDAMTYHEFFDDFGVS
jgi:hypothetical protein